MANILLGCCFSLFSSVFQLVTNSVYVECDDCFLTTSAVSVFRIAKAGEAGEEEEERVNSKWSASRLKAILNIASLNWRRPTWQSCLQLLWF